jgi:hypothetical protein
MSGTATTSTICLAMNLPTRVRCPTICVNPEIRKVSGSFRTPLPNEGDSIAQLLAFSRKQRLEAQEAISTAKLSS